MRDLLLRNARIVDLGAGQGHDTPFDVLVRAGTVVEVGPGLDRPAGLEEYDAEGRWLIPGLWDQHVHLGQWTVSSQRLDLAATWSPEEATALVAERLAEVPDEPLIGWGHRLSRWPRDPTVAELDEVAPDTPVILISGDGHHAWLNSTALIALALPVRDSVVVEREWFAAYGRLVTLTGHDGTSPAAYQRTMEAAAAMGVTGVVDFEFSGDHTDWAERVAEGADLLRVRMATYADGLDAVIAAGFRTGDPLPGCGDLVTMGPLKIISDGSLNTRTAWCCEPYADGSGSGEPNQSDEELHDLLKAAVGNDLEVATHAIGDAAIHGALLAYEATGATGSIEHAQLIRREDVRRLADLGVRASVQPAHLIDDRDATERVWADRADRSFALRWMLDDGVTLALGSDAPVSPLDPWLAMAAAVHRSGDQREPWHPEQALTPREALAASVDGQGTVRPGSRGDLVLLDADPLDPTGGSLEQADRLRDMTVHATWVAGRLVHGEPSLFRPE
jgi:predicted amidohydrolase YtcJ